MPVGAASSRRCRHLDCAIRGARNARPGARGWLSNLPRPSSTCTSRHAAVRNPHGVMYKCWKGGEGSITILGRQDGRYGRLGWRNPDDDTVDYSLPLPASDKHQIIDNHGVSVILLGKSQEDDTTIAPPGADLPSQWVAAYLERRYFEVP